MKIYIDADHNGFELKHQLIDYMKRSGYEVIDVGAPERDPEDDFTFAAGRVANAVLAEDDVRGVLLCGSGQGVCMAANRFKGIRAGLAWDTHEAKAARNDSDSNVLCLPANVLDFETAKTILHTWLDTPFAGAPRFKRRIEQLDALG
jgi:ribose 5-phosphate isomerase B